MQRSLRDAAAAVLARQPRPAVVQTRRGPVEVVTAGEGPVIFALHGGMGGYDQGLLLIEAAINMPGFRFLSVSRPGYLGTPLSAGRSPAEQADLYADLLDALGIEKTAVIAVSGGGPSALQFALRHPQRCWGLILVSACTGPLQIPRRFRFALIMMALAARWPALAKWMRRKAQRDPDAATGRSIGDPGLRARTLADPRSGPLLLALQESTQDRLASRIAGTRNDIRQFRTIAAAAAGGITAPILVVHGTGDRIVPFVHVQAVVDHAPGAELLAIQDGEHVSLFIHRDMINTRVCEFLAAHRPD